MPNGSARSKVLRQILADVFGKTLMISDVTEQAGLGAAMCAAIAAGECSSLEEACSRYVSRKLMPVEPIRAHEKVYRQQFGLFYELYRQNEPIFDKMTL